MAGLIGLHDIDGTGGTTWDHGDPVDLAQDAWADDPDRVDLDNLPDVEEPEANYYESDGEVDCWEVA
jgi:hypothetical protein